MLPVDELDKDGYAWYVIAPDGTMFRQRDAGDANALACAAGLGLARAFMDIDVEPVPLNYPTRTTRITLEPLDE